MYCRKCGSQLEDEKDFCANCGERVDSVVTERENEVGLNIMFAILAFVFPIVGFPIAFCLRDKMPKRSKAVLIGSFIGVFLVVVLWFIYISMIIGIATTGMKMSRYY